MKNLIEIVNIATLKRIKKIEIFDNNSRHNSDSKFNQFYDGLAERKFKNDRDAAKSLYDSDPTNAKYRQLKSRFRRRLLNTLFFLDANKPSANNYDRAYFTCNKEWTLVKILIAYKAYSSAEGLARQILTTALRFRFADIIINCSRILREFAAKAPAPKAYEIYDGYIKQYTDTLSAEIRSEEFYQRVSMNYYLPPSKNNDLKTKIDTYCNALISLSEAYEDSPTVAYNMFLVWIMRYEMLGDYDSMLEITGEAINYIDAHSEYSQEVKLIMIYNRMMAAHLHLRHFSNGKATAEQCLSKLSAGTKEWFTFMEYYFLLAMHTDNFLQASAIFSLAANHPAFRKLQPNDREKWTLFEGYLMMLIEYGKADKSWLSRLKRRYFSSSEHLDELPDYPKKKRGLAVITLILQVMMQLKRPKTASMRERIEMLRFMANRQLKKEEYYRSIQFIRLLQALTKAQFQPDEISSTSDRYYTNLIEHPFSYRGMISELEIIPYEKLWVMIKEVVEN